MGSAQGSQGRVTALLQYLNHGGIIVMIKDTRRRTPEFQSGFLRVVDRFERSAKAVSLQYRFADPRAGHDS